MLELKNVNLCVVGLGYVGLPLAVEFGKQRSVVGFDINESRVNELQGGCDRTLEVSEGGLKSASGLVFSCDSKEIDSCNIYIVTVPTPVDESKRPDLSPLISASKMIGKALKKGDIVIYESTVYPGATEEVCIPVLEQSSSLLFNKDFYAGYSPERINPGDKQHTVANITKVTSGSTVEAAELVDQLYKTIILAGTHKASSIKVAEAAKVIENTQRDVNIALINELAVIFNRLEIDTLDVLEAAGTKWNFLPFRPGLVGGHCIGVDPYYLTHKAQEIGYNPEMILAGRRLNDSMGEYIVANLVKLMASRSISIVNSRVLVMGLAFKENCPDLRNTRVVDILDELKVYGAKVDVCDPWVDADEARRAYGVSVLSSLPSNNTYDAVLLAVGHKQFLEFPSNIENCGKENSVIYDIKSVLPKDIVDARL